MSRFIVLDIVFYAGSLNYDQGSGNFQELKKITKWDGQQYSYVSRYALRYSILEQARKDGTWDLADARKLHKISDNDQAVIQPAVDSLLSGEILQFPEFDLFGYLVTNTVPANSRVSPVRISPAISLTPFSYDNLLSGNLGLAKRRMEQEGKMDPNLFNTEEHYSYYVYSVVIDVERIGENTVYLAKSDNKSTSKWQVEANEASDNGSYKIIISKADKEVNGHYRIEKSKTIGKKKGEYTITSEMPNLEEVKDENNKVSAYQINQSISDNEKKDRIKDLIKTVLNTHRWIKGTDHDLSPEMIVVGDYNKEPYQTFKDRISLADEYEESYEEDSSGGSKEGNKKITVRVKKTRTPTFYVNGVTLKDVDSKEAMVNKVLTQLGYDDDNAQNSQDKENPKAYFLKNNVKVNPKSSSKQ